MARNNFAVFVDLENAGGKVSTLGSVIDQVKLKGDILLGKAYGYTERFEPLKEMLLSNTFYVVPSLRYGYMQKNNMDIQLVIDALEVAYKNDLIDSFCIVSGDSDYTPLVGKLKSMGKYVLGISRSEAASSIFINACNEFIFLESVNPVREETASVEETDPVQELCSLVCKIIDEQGDAEDTLYASELKSTLMRLKPDFNERNYGYASFGKLLQALADRCGKFELVNEEFSVKVRLVSVNHGGAALTRDNWMDAFKATLSDLKNKGFERVNPSIVKSVIQQEYPDYDERTIGFKKFSDVMKRLERERIVRVEMDEQRSMLVKIL